MPIVLKGFQQKLCETILDRFRSLKAAYDKLGDADEAAWRRVRKSRGTVMLQAPTGAGKTVLAIDIVARFSEQDRVLWFWFAPFSGVIDQTRKSLRDGSPRLSLLDLATDRKPDLISGGGVFVTTWQSVATRNVEGRKARQSGDLGLSVDDLVALAREEGFRIGCVVDEAHHGFQKATESQRFFAEVLQPDYTLLMTATPNDKDARTFSSATGYEVGTPEEWISVSRYDGVAEGLLKKGVKMARFIAKKDDERRLISFEHTALAQCAAMHREIRAAIAEKEIALTPLMLVQVPNGRKAQSEAMEYLVQRLGFAQSAVRLHTADEPDADLIALANDPSVEVLIFKMAVAMGFDAPRAWTLAALRGTRDADFGIQVVGRLMRVHHTLQGAHGIPEFLHYGYVFLANDEAQEGLLNAGSLINKMETRAPLLESDIVITCYGDEKQAQFVKSGQNIRLFIETDEDGGVTLQKVEDLKPLPATYSGKAEQTFIDFGQSTETKASGGDEVQPAREPLFRFLQSQKSAVYRYTRKNDAPKHLWSEYLPDIEDDFEDRILAHICFDPVIGDRDRRRVGVKKVERDVFDTEGKNASEHDVWTDLEPEAVAIRARQTLLRFEDIDHGRFPRMLLEQFRTTIVRLGIEPPEDQEKLEQQLDLVLVRNPDLIRNAYKKCRMDSVTVRQVVLSAEMIAEGFVDAARRNIYGVFPLDMNTDETAVARLLDEDPLVEWWHRNTVRRADSVALYGWADGEGFFPDFVVKVKERKIGDGIALLEVKGPHLREAERKKAGAVHKTYGKVFMAGRKMPGSPSFSLFRFEDDRLHEDGAFEIVRMRW